MQLVLTRTFCIEIKAFHVYATHSGILLLKMLPMGLLGLVFLHHSLSRVFRNVRVCGKDVSSA